MVNGQFIVGTERENKWLTSLSIQDFKNNKTQSRWSVSWKKTANLWEKIIVLNL